MASVKTTSGKISGKLWVSQCHLQRQQVSVWDDSCSHSDLVTRGVRSHGFSHHLTEFNMKRDKFCFFLLLCFQGCCWLWVRIVSSEMVFPSQASLLTLVLSVALLGAGGTSIPHQHPSAPAVGGSVPKNAVFSPKPALDHVLFIQASKFELAEWKSQ